MVARLSAKQQLFTATFTPVTAYVRTSNVVRKPAPQELELVTSPGVYGPDENGGVVNSPAWWVVDIYLRGSILQASTPKQQDLSNLVLDDRASSALPFHFKVKVGTRSDASYTEQHWIIDAASTRLFVYGCSVGLVAVGEDYAIQQRDRPLPEADLLIAGRHTVGISTLRSCNDAGYRRSMGPSYAQPPSSSLRIDVPSADPGPDWGVPIPAGALFVTVYDIRPWVWQLGRPAFSILPGIAQNQRTRIPNIAGFIRPAEFVGLQRTVLMVFEVSIT